MSGLAEGTIDGEAVPRDPYDAVTGSLKGLLESCRIRLSGKFPVPSWLRPRPEAEDYPLVTAQRTGEFYDSGGFTSLLKQLQEFVEREIFPGLPVMAGVDHAATMAVISALTEKFGPENLGVLVFDQHFDALPISVRLAESGGTSTGPMGGVPPALSQVRNGLYDQCCCGNFWSSLMDEGKVKPENLSFIGVADYPGEPAGPDGGAFRQAYLEYARRGCGFFPLNQLEGDYTGPLADYIDRRLQTPLIYISLDLDVGSYNFTWAARYMDRPGISSAGLLEAAALVRETCRRKNISLAGLDIMEFNMHFLGIEAEDGTRDATLPVIGEFIQKLLG